MDITIEQIIMLLFMVFIWFAFGVVVGITLIVLVDRRNR